MMSKRGRQWLLHRLHFPADCVQLSCPSDWSSPLWVAILRFLNFAPASSSGSRLSVSLSLLSPQLHRHNVSENIRSLSNK